MNTFTFYQTPTGKYMSEFVCIGCRNKFQVLSDSESKLKQIMCKKKYCKECAKEVIRKSNYITNRKRKSLRVIEDPVTMREFNEGYERFWKKRGITPPQVDPWRVKF